MSRIVLRNKTRYPDDEVKRLIRFAAKDLELPSRHSILVRLSHIRLSKNRRETGGEYEYLYAATGKAHDFVYLRKDTPRGAAWEVHLCIGREDEYPLPWHDRRESPIGMCQDWREALVAVAAHELKHVEDFQRGQVRGRRSLSTYQVENRCDAYAAGRVRTWRES